MIEGNSYDIVTVFQYFQSLEDMKSFILDCLEKEFYDLSYDDQFKMLILLFFRSEVYRIQGLDISDFLPILREQSEYFQSYKNFLAQSLVLNN